MSDIVDRLRGVLVMSMFANSKDLHAEQVRQRHEAANEIERLRAQRDELAAELRAIRDASPKAWELPIVEFCEEFRVWAQSRAREALAKQEGKQ